MERLLFLDIDGTLLDWKKDDIYPDTVLDIRKAQKNGVQVLINTGRSFHEIPDMIKTFGFDGIISACGGDIQYHGQTIYHHSLGSTNIHLIDQATFDQQLFCNYEGQYNNYMPKSLQSLYQEKYKDFLFRFKVEYVDWPLSNDQADQIMKVTMLDFEMGEWLNPLKENMKVILHQADEKHHCAAEIIPSSHSKANGMNHLKQWLDQDVYMVAIGDGNNDIEMLQAADRSFWMSNGTPSVRQYASDACAHIQQNGIGDALRKLGWI